VQDQPAIGGEPLREPPEGGAVVGDVLEDIGADDQVEALALECA